ILAALLAIATVGLVIELIRNPITRVSHTTDGPTLGFIASNKAVLRSPWARTLIAMAFIEAFAIFGAFTYVGADLHLRFDVGFALIGLFVGFFAVGGLIYSLLVRTFIARFGPSGLAAVGGSLLAAAYVILALGV